MKGAADFSQFKTNKNNNNTLVIYQFSVVGRDFAITDHVSAVNLTGHNRIKSAEIIGYNDLFIRNDNSSNSFIITNNDQLSFNYHFYFFHRFKNTA